MRRLVGVLPVDDARALRALVDTTCDRAVTRARDLVAGVDAGRVDAMQYLREMDGVSHMMCRVVDPLQLCRDVHAHPGTRTVAASALEQLSDVFERLNSDRALYLRGKHLLEKDRSVGRIDGDSERTLALLLRDFETAGVGIEAEAERAEVKQLIHEVHVDTHRLRMSFAAPSPWKSVALDADRAGGAGVLSQLRRELTRGKDYLQDGMGNLSLVCTHAAHNAVMRYVSRADTRRDFLAAYLHNRMKPYVSMEP